MPPEDSTALNEQFQYEQFNPKPLPPPHGRLWVQIGLFIATVLSTTLVGASHYLSFQIEFDKVQDLIANSPAFFREASGQPLFYVHGLWYSVTILSILGCHEMGHYVACLRYGVLATRPFFLPIPPLDPYLPTFTGTFGAFIRIKSRIPDKIALFDIGVAGPLAGFAVAVPALFIGMAMSRVDRLPVDTSHFGNLGEPLLFKFAAWSIWGTIPTGYSLNLHPVAFAAWFGLLATALNLFPIGQLDGGHIAYAVLGERSVKLTYAGIALAIGLTVFSLSWVVWTALLLLMLKLVGPHHPPTLNDELELGSGRRYVAALAAVILVLCFTPAPISF